MIQMHQLARAAILKIIEEEGGWVYTDHPTDKDKGTYAGIRWVTFNTYRITQNHKTVTPSEFKHLAENAYINDAVMDIYCSEYYEKLGIDRLVDVLKMPVLSCGVNCGTRRAGMILQRTINETPDANSTGALQYDGIIGPMTLEALDKLVYAPIHFSHNYASDLEMDVKLQGLVNIDRFRNNFVKNWCQRYVNITVDKPEYVEFLKGWFNRANKYWV